MDRDNQVTTNWQLGGEECHLTIISPHKNVRGQFWVVLNYNRLSTVTEIGA